MSKARIYDFVLFFSAIAIAFYSRELTIDVSLYIKALLLFLTFSMLYQHLRIVDKTGSSSFDYGINYSLAFGIFAGPFGLFIFEAIYRFMIFFRRKQTKTDDPEELSDTFYNIGAFTIIYSTGYYLFDFLSPIFNEINPLGYWLLIILLVCVTSLLIDLFLVVAFFLLKDIKTMEEAIDFFKSRNIPDMAKTALTNGLLLLFLLEVDWDMLIVLFCLNYIVSLSFYSKSQSIKDKLDRDKFEQMAYTDFLTGVNNRAFMDKRMAELGHTQEYIGIVVADIDNFKSINDSYNHSVGDQVIKHYASMLKSFLNSGDNLFRSGGEEFTIFLRNRNYNQCRELVERILREVHERVVEVDFGSEHIYVSYTSSFGLYYFKVKSQNSLEKGYIQADQLLLESKRDGRNRITSVSECTGAFHSALIR
ncbi:diguanylate cyclase [Bacillus sp. FJAT-27225]|uniref:GGDEF domain-containing protein n=1 Tax=Bacillus sp. FJAT-27225 TaxID=1743144 RepID=UPI00080C293F|nr:GGDEF domain-containing protein [Bacillus sp. FJAT-27225]OCA82295.1 diguanylate cyclase [Bacillus sp. FJAT-27225]